jgi:NAD(P)-dependent dehydrogenase (short-subunit alcohol dehydrogenase family)
MQGKTVVVTGGTSGIGEIAAIELAKKGARILLVARDAVRADAVLAKLRAANGDAAHGVHLADLSRIAEMKRVGAEIALVEPRIDVLINNAGAVFTKRQESADGLEMTFAVNHMAYFVLTNMLLTGLKATPGARIVNTAAMGYRYGKLDFDDLQLKKHYSAVAAYSRTKLCNVLFTRELASRFADTGVTANCLHPGTVSTRLGHNNSGLLIMMLKIAMPLFLISPEEGAKTIIYLASSPDVANVTGGYYYKCKRENLKAIAMNDVDAQRLWKASAMLSGVG